MILILDVGPEEHCYTTPTPALAVVALFTRLETIKPDDEATFPWTEGGDKKSGPWQSSVGDANSVESVTIQQPSGENGGAGASGEAADQEAPPANEGLRKFAAGLSPSIAFASCQRETVY